MTTKVEEVAWPVVTWS